MSAVNMDISFLMMKIIWP